MYPLRWVIRRRRRFRGLGVPRLSIAILGVVVTCAAFAPILAPYDPTGIDLISARTPPFTVFEHPLGTDTLGRDILSRLIYGARSSMAVSVSAIFIAVVFGAALGLVSGYFGGGLDRLSMRITDGFLGFPAILSAMLVVVIFGRGLQNVVFAVALTTWPRFARMVRGEVLRHRDADFVLFARIAGVPRRTIIRRHILPNLMSTIVVVSTLMMAEVVLLESALSFLGLGFPPGAPAWGIMVAEGREVLRQVWWLSVFPGIAITAVVIAASFVGDWLGDYLDPRRGLTEGSATPLRQDEPNPA